MPKCLYCPNEVIGAKWHPECRIRFLEKKVQFLEASARHSHHEVLGKLDEMADLLVSCNRATEELLKQLFSPDLSPKIVECDFASSDPRPPIKIDTDHEVVPNPHKVKNHIWNIREIRPDKTTEP
jgi:hypothetical protein